MSVRDESNRLLDLSAVAWNKGDIRSVIMYCSQIIANDPEHYAAYSNLGTALWASGEAAEAEKNFRKSLKLKPDYMEALLNMGTLCHDKGDLDGASEFYETALKLRPHNADLKWRKSIIALAKGDYINGWNLYEEGLGVASIRGKLLEFKKAPWTGNACNHLLICHEQGYGDTLQFIRYAQLCKTRARKIYVLCPKELHKIVSSCPWVDGVMETAHDGDFEDYVYSMSLPHIFQTTVDTIPAPIPYLKPSNVALEKWTPRFKDVKNLKVGLVWAGNPRKQEVRFRVIDGKRSMSLDRFAKMFDLPVTFYSLQKGEDSEPQCAKFPKIINFMSEVTDFDDTAAIIQNLDLVISVDTSVVHLTGALSKPVWVLSRKDACWRWLENRVDSPWYPTAKIYGQPNNGDWDSVIDSIYEDLGKLT